MGDKKITNKRSNFRYPIVVPIRLVDEHGNENEAISGNVSDCGLYITMTAGDRPDLNSIVQVQIMTPLGDGSEAPVNRARVMRSDEEGVGLQFLFEDDE